MLSKHGKRKIMVIAVMIIAVICISYFLYIIFVPSKVTLPPGTDITVDDSGNADYTTIQDAVNAANEGNTIFVYSPVEKFEFIVQYIIVIVVAIIIISLITIEIIYARKRRKQGEKRLRGYTPIDVKPITVACPYCRSTFQFLKIIFLGGTAI